MAEEVQIVNTDYVGKIRNPLGVIGLSNAEVGGELGLSEATVKTHLTSILRKLDLRDRTQVVVLAYERGLVVPGG